MKGILKYMVCPLVAGLALTACSPDEFSGADKNGLPEIGGRTITVETDQETNTAVFSISGDFKGCYPVWYLDGKMYSLLPKTSYSSMSEGTHALEVTLMNRNGQSQGSLTGSFTFNETKIDYDAEYYSKLCGKEWRVDYTEVGHMGCGEPGTDGSNWWSADVNNKKDWGVYDDRITFSHSAGDPATEGTYTYDPGEGGTVYVNTGCTIFPEYNTGDGQDFMVPVEKQTSKFELKPGTYNDEPTLYLQFAPQTLLPYISADAAYNNPFFRVEALTNTRLVLIYDGDGIVWRMVFTSREDTGLPTEPEVPAATFDWNVDASSNQWKAVTDGSAIVGIDTWFADGGWNLLPTQPDIVTTADGFEVVVPEGTGGDQWQGQVKIHTSLSAKGGKPYNFYCLVDADNDVPGMTIKLTESGEGRDGNFFFADRHNISADKQFVYKAEGVTLKEGVYAPALSLVLDLGGAPAGTKVKVTKIYFEEDNTVGYDDPANLWRSVDSGEAFLNFTTWFADGSWQALPTQPEIAHDGNAYTLTIPEGTGGDQWQGQVLIHTSLTAQMASSYNFSCTIEMDNDAPGVTIKLTESNESEEVKHDNNFFFDGRHAVTADKAFVYSAKGVTLPLNDAHALSLVLDFGGTPAGTKVKISNIIFSKAD